MTRDEALAKAYAKGLTSTLLATIAGLSPQHTRFCIVSGGGKMRTRGEANRARGKSDMERSMLKSCLKAYQEQGDSARQIAKTLGYHRSTVLRWMRRFMLKVGLPANRRGPENPSWNDGRTVDSDGYVHLLLPGHPRADSRGYVREHILVAEEMLERPLKEGEEIHHLDRDRANNAPMNLIVCASHEAHMKRYHGIGQFEEVVPKWLDDAVSEEKRNIEKGLSV